MNCKQYNNCVDNPLATPYERQKLQRDCYYKNPIQIIEPFELTPFWVRLIFVVFSLILAIGLIYFIVNYTFIGGQKIIDIKYPTFTSSDITGITDLPSYIK